jgi:hypothetical protein
VKRYHFAIMSLFAIVYIAMMDKEDHSPFFVTALTFKLSKATTASSMGHIRSLASTSSDDQRFLNLYSVQIPEGKEVLLRGDWKLKFAGRDEFSVALWTRPAKGKGFYLLGQDKKGYSKKKHGFEIFMTKFLNKKNTSLVTADFAKELHEFEFIAGQGNSFKINKGVATRVTRSIASEFLAPLKANTENAQDNLKQLVRGKDESSKRYLLRKVVFKQSVQYFSLGEEFGSVTKSLSDKTYFTGNVDAFIFGKEVSLALTTVSAENSSFEYKEGGDRGLGVVSAQGEDALIFMASNGRFAGWKLYFSLDMGKKEQGEEEVREALKDSSSDGGEETNQDRIGKPSAELAMNNAELKDQNQVLKKRYDDIRKNSPKEQDQDLGYEF